MIGIMLMTYDRLDYACTTLESIVKNLKSPEPLWLHIADDGSSQTYRDTLFDLGKKHFGDNVSITNSERGGYGASYNQATQLVHHICDLVLPLEDDWELIRPLDISPIVQGLRQELFGCCRMGYIGYTQRLQGWFLSGVGRQWLALDPASPEPHVFAGGPRLETAEWGRMVGPWPEGLAAGDTEFAVAHRPEARTGVVWPVDLIKPAGDAFVHIGSRDVKDEPLRVKEEAVLI